MLALAGIVAAGSAGARQAEPAEAPRVIVAVLPYETTIARIAEIPEVAPGIVSAGIGAVPVAQTFLDIAQGNRINKKLYDAELPRVYVRDGGVPGRVWRQVVERADEAPAELVPGLLGSTLADAGVPVTAEDDSGLATLIGVDRSGTIATAPPGVCDRGCAAGLSVIRARMRELGGIAAALGPEDMLIAIAAGARAEQQLLPIGIVAPGYGANLTSASTRTDGVVISTDIAPTVLEHLAVAVPDEMNGAGIVSEGERDAAAIADLQTRLETRPGRVRVVLVPLGIWLLAVCVAAAIGRRRLARPGLRLVGLAAAWAPALLLLAAAADAGEPASAVINGLGSPILAAITDRFVRGWRGLALACAVTVAAHAVDVVVGSPLTALSVLGPNPGGGVRFFGIGNELEAILTSLTLIGTGAWLATRRRLERGHAAIWFAAIALLAAAAYAPGRFGADVGAAIVLGVGAATAAVLALGMAPRRAALTIAGAGVGALAVLFVVDAVLGGAHLSRSVLGAGGATDVLEVLERRLELMLSTFVRPVYPELLAATAVTVALGVWQRKRVLSWFGPAWPARCGWLGAVAGVLVGTVANDSGSVLLVVGAIYVSLAAGFAWGVADRRPSGGSPTDVGA